MSALFTRPKNFMIALHKTRPFLIPLWGVLFLVLASLQKIINDVTAGDTHAIDTHILERLRDPADRTNPLGPRWLEEMMRDFSALGGVALLTFITIGTALYLFVNRKPSEAWFLLTAIGSGTLLTNLLKAGFDRPRPDLVAHETYTYAASFPSGHAMMAALVYLTLGGVLAQNEKHYSMKLFLMGIAVVLALLVGISRIYLGAHWASDVVAGWLAGCAWSILFWLLADYMRHRSQRQTKRHSP